MENVDIIASTREDAWFHANAVIDSRAAGLGHLLDTANSDLAWRSQFRCRWSSVRGFETVYQRPYAVQTRNSYNLRVTTVDNSLVEGH